jgi:hypothetical protein
MIIPSPSLIILSLPGSRPLGYCDPVRVREAMPAGRRRRKVYPEGEK